MIQQALAYPEFTSLPPSSDESGRRAPAQDVQTNRLEGYKTLTSSQLASRLVRKPVQQATTTAHAAAAPAHAPVVHATEEPVVVATSLPPRRPVIAAEPITLTVQSTAAKRAAERAAEPNETYEEMRAREMARHLRELQARETYYRQLKLDATRLREAREGSRAPPQCPHDSAEEGSDDDDDMDSHDGLLDDEGYPETAGQQSDGADGEEGDELAADHDPSQLPLGFEAPR